MALILDISTRKLVQGENITIQTYSDNPGTVLTGTYVINVLNATSIPATLEVNETNSYIPSTDILKESVSRLANVIQQIGKVVNVTTKESVISIAFDSDTLDANCSNTTNTIEVKKIKNDGSVINVNPPFVTNITVTSITHQLVDFITPLLNIPHGVMGDKLETKIYFTVANAFQVLDFWYGWVDNTENIYPNQNDFQIDLSNFEDITTGAVQRYSGDTSSMSAVSPLQGNKVQSMSLIDLGSNNYVLSFIHILPILPRLEDVSGQALVKPSEISTSLKMPFQISLKSSFFDTNVSETTAKQNLLTFIGNGNIGYFNQILNTGLKYYNLTSFVWNNTENKLNSGFDTQGTIVITNTNNNFNINYDVLLKIVEITDEYNEELSLLQNIKFSTIKLKMDGVVTSNAVFKNVSATFSTNQTTINFEIAKNTYPNQYALWCEIGSGTASYDKQNVLIKVDEATNLADTTTVVFGTYPSATRQEYNYNNHYNLDIATSFNQVRSFVDDFQLSRFRVTNNDLANNDLVKFTIRVRSNNNILDTFEVNKEDLNFTFNRNYNLDVADLHNFVTVDYDNAGNYDFVYPFQINESWTNLTNVVQETIAIFNQTTASGVVQFKNTWISPVFEFGKYDQTKNTFGEPQITVPPANIKYYNQAGTEEVGKILNVGITKIVATFTETNLNDLQCSPPAPFTYLDNDFTNDYLCAYFGILGKGQYFRFHNLQDNGQTPFLGNFPILERVSVNEAKLTAYIDATDVKKTFGTDFECLQITARLDKIFLGLPTTKAYLNSAYSNGYS